jgi:hypothetical protein
VNPALSPTHLNVHRTPLARLASDHFPLVCELTLKLNNGALGESDMKYVAIGNRAGRQQRSDGAMFWLRRELIVRLELPAAREYEAKLEAEKEQKARESVPQF